MTSPGIRIAPSLLSADFADLKGAIAVVEQAGVDMLHLDVMDGHFVPNITIGPFIIEAIRRVSKSDLDVHLMIEDPAKYLERFVRAGSTYITFHVEAIAQARQLVEKAMALGVKAGVALNPGTPLEAAARVLEIADIIVIMTVNPGFGGQSFIETCLPKIERLASSVQKRGLKTRIEVDGGVTPETAGRVCAAGASVLVAGTAVFGKKDYAQAIAALKAAGAGPGVT
jgi:ribulose-phosphate 3-epimerase